MADSLIKKKKKIITYTTHCYSLQRYRNSSFVTNESSSPFVLYQDFDA